MFTGVIKMLNRAKKSGLKPKQLKTFTYYIPAPPNRKNGYREKEFDKILHGILQSGFELVDLKTESVSNGDQGGGLFIIALLNAPTEKIAKKDAHLDIHEQFKLSHTHSSPDFILEEDDDA
jgi:hypothetical protein